jgi:hypothetical protein
MADKRTSVETDILDYNHWEVQEKHVQKPKPISNVLENRYFRDCRLGESFRLSKWGSLNYPNRATFFNHACDVAGVECKHAYVYHFDPLLSDWITQEEDWRLGF